MFVYILKREISYNSYWLYSSLLCHDNLCTKTDAGDEMKYNRVPKNTEARQENTENTKENTKNTTEINWD